MNNQISMVTQEGFNLERVTVCDGHARPLLRRGAIVTGKSNDGCYFCDKAWHENMKRVMERQESWLSKIETNDIVYLSGPMTGIQNFNRERFWLMEHIVKQRASAVLTPARYLDSETASYEELMKRGIRMVTEATKMVQLTGWGTSSGSMIEYHVAMIIGLPVYQENP